MSRSRGARWSGARWSGTRGSGARGSGAGGVLVSALLAVLLTAGCGSSGPGGSSSAAKPAPSELIGHTGGAYQGLELTPPRPRPQFTLTDTAGREFKFGAETAGKPTLLFFGFTHCPDVCPTTLADIANGLRQVPAAVRAQTQMVFVTTDVKRDSAAVIRNYLTKFDVGLPNKFIGLRGTQSAIDAAQVAARVTLAEDEGQTHSAQVLLYGTDDYARVAFLQSTNGAAQLAHDLPLVAEAK
ncbi:MAG TPA: SCO family protein [Jatrophihabitans sp.]|jgi:protein SCO1/2|uniref:SCO family protein n=1 Tax=Jatrophihabitans sp. TaxID=1932789 RepID=UPI002F03BEA7